MQMVASARVWVGLGGLGAGEEGGVQNVASHVLPAHAFSQARKIQCSTVSTYRNMRAGAGESQRLSRNMSRRTERSENKVSVKEEEDSSAGEKESMLARLCNDRSDRLSRPSAVGSTRALMRVVGYKRRVVRGVGGVVRWGTEVPRSARSPVGSLGWRVSAFIARPLPQKKGERDPRRKSGPPVE